MALNITRQALEDLANNSEGEAYFGYSGRGMYGAECVGITLDSTTHLVRLGGLIREAFENDEIDVHLYDELTENGSLDDMGRSIIIYWRGVNCDDAPEEE